MPRKKAYSDSTASSVWYIAAYQVYDPVTRDAEGNPSVNLRRTIHMDEHSTAKERKIFYETILKLPWLPTKIRSAIMGEMGFSLKAHKNKINQVRALTRMSNILHSEAAHRRSGKRHGAYSTALKQEASRLGMDVETLKKQLDRHVTAEDKESMRRALSPRSKF